MSVFLRGGVSAFNFQSLAFFSDPDLLHHLRCVSLVSHVCCCSTNDSSAEASLPVIFATSDSPSASLRAVDRTFSYIMADKEGPILVTGTVGFIASRVAELLLESGRRVLGVDNFSGMEEFSAKNDREIHFCAKEGTIFFFFGDCVV